MQMFTVTVAQTRHRLLSVPAPDAAAATRAAKLVLGRNERVVGAAPEGASTTTVDAGAALNWLMGQPFLPRKRGTAPEPLALWAAPARTIPGMGETLAVAGLRWIEGEDLFIGSARSVPWLATTCRATPLAGAMLIEVLATMQGASRAGNGRRLAGISTRGVIVPRAAARDAMEVFLQEAA
jgi:hypothetical protein